MTEEHQVEAVVFGVPDAGYPWSLDDAATIPYDDRLKIPLVVLGTETLADIVNRASDELDIPLPEAEWVPPPERLSDLLSYSALYHREERFGIPSFTHTFPTVDEDGGARLAVPWAEVQYAQLLQSSDRGLVDGDVSRPYIFLPTAFGDFPGFGWPDVVAALKVFWQATEYTATALGAVTGTHWIIERLNGIRRRTHTRRALVEKYSSGWNDRGAAPADLDKLLSLRAWKSEELAALLGCTKEEAEAILWALGASYNHADARWYRDRSMEDKLIHGDLTIAIWQRRRPGEEAKLEPVVIERLQRYLESGQVPPLPWEGPG